MKTALFTVAYQQAEPFIGDCLASAAAQDDQDFDFLILNDGANVQLLAGIPNGKVREATGSAAALRRQGIEWMRSEGYEVAIFADIDDRFDASRVSLSRQLLRGWDIVVNELMLFGEGFTVPYQMLGTRLLEGQEIGEQHLRHSNCMGMSNTAARLSSIAEAADTVPDDVVAFDWNLYARALMGGAKARFTGATTTEYRQHGANIAGIFNQSEQQILRGVEVKANHYALLGSCNAWYAEQAVEYELLRKRLRANPASLRDYCEQVRTKTPARPLWWESIRLDKELS